MLGDADTAKSRLDDDLESYMKQVGQEDEQSEGGDQKDDSTEGSAVSDALEEKKEEDGAQ
jgi:hypothetical protein